jgi:heat-inducible transcriptional repressor
MKTGGIPTRRGTILRVVVAHYIACGVPAASEAVARRYSLRISPATVRNEMALLEEQGYIRRSHSSAGAMPSDKGYRYYVESLVNGARMSQRERRRIQEFFSQVEGEPDEWARLAVSVLTQRLRSIAVATPARAAVCHFRRLEMIRLQELVAMVVVVLQEGQIKQRLIVLEPGTSEDKLSAMANKLNEAYVGLDYAGISSRMLDLHLSSVEEIMTRLLIEVMETEDNRQYERCYLDGWRYLLGSGEVIGNQRMLDLAEALEERSILSTLLDGLGDSGEIRITIGDENANEVLRGCSVIMSNYGACGRRGAVGVIGPTRMPYSRAIPMVEYVSTLMSGLVETVYA